MKNTSGSIGCGVVIVILTCALAACSALDSSPDSIQITATPDPTLHANFTEATADAAGLTMDAVPTVDPANPVNPLTGLRVADPAVLQRRPLAIKISNAPAVVRPQAGIGAADLVFEHYVEGNLTRFTAIFWTNTPPRVGSVRSARLIDLELPAMYDTLFAYSGAAEPIRQRIADLPFAPRAYEGVTTGEPLYYRDPTREAPHNLFAIPAAIWARASADGVNDPPEQLDQMLFAPTLPGDPADIADIVDRAAGQIVTIDYGPDTVRWVYDAASARYWRTVNGEPHTDANTRAQVSAANVVLIYAHHQEDLSIVESEWQGNKDFSIEIQIWTLGPAIILRDGYRIDGYWMRWEEDTMLSFWRDEAATQQIALKPGNTWFQVVPLDFADVQIE
ncbi:MAG: DUF3048 domain-containing protein [Anaerolineae bacterium]|nr:DUF3048 domain-containing protein [Anaerolineae bacterium]